MIGIYDRIWQLAVKYLDTRQNEVHTAISLSLAKRLLRREEGQKEIVIPAVILHDVGWKEIPEALQITAFGPRSTAPELNRKHELEGVRIAGEVLQRVDYPADKTKEILEIIMGHDSRDSAISRNDMIVKDSDRLWRYTRTGFGIDIDRFGETPQEGLERLETHLYRWLFTPAARALAVWELRLRREEWQR